MALRQFRRPAGSWCCDPEDADRSGDVLDLLLAYVLEGQIELIAHLVADLARDAEPARFGEAFEARRDVDAIPIDVIAVDDDIAEIYADTELDSAVGRHLHIALRYAALHVDGASQRIHDTREFR